MRRASRISKSVACRRKSGLLETRDGCLFGGEISHKEAIAVRRITQDKTLFRLGHRDESGALAVATKKRRPQMLHGAFELENKDGLRLLDRGNSNSGGQLHLGNFPPDRKLEGKKFIGALRRSGGAAHDQNLVRRDGRLWPISRKSSPRKSQASAPATNGVSFSSKCAGHNQAARGSVEEEFSADKLPLRTHAGVDLPKPIRG